MKKIILSIILVASLIMPSFAQINVETMMDSQDPEKVTLEGTSAYYGKFVTIQVHDKENNEKMYYLDQSKTGLNGDFEFSFNIPEGKTGIGKIKIEDETKNIEISVEQGDKEALNEKVQAAIENTSNYMINNSTYNSDWKIVGLANAGKPIPQSYLRDTEENIENSKGYFRKVTDYERITIGVTAAGGNPRNIGGYDLLEKIYNFQDGDKDITFQGINGVIYGLIALDSKRYSIPSNSKYDRDWLIEYILNSQTDEGGWNLSGEQGGSDVDITSMALISLAPYHEYSGVEEKINNAVAWLSKVQREDNGGFDSWEVDDNCESVCQAIIGLCANGIDPTSEKFTKNGFNLMDALLSFAKEDGTFLHTKDEAGNVGMSTEQAYQALLAYNKFVKMGEKYCNGKNSIYYFGEAPSYSVTIEAESKKINENEKTRLRVKVLDSIGDEVEGKDIVWTSSDEKIVSIDKYGEATGINSGKTTIRAELKEDSKIYDEIQLEVEGYGESILEIEIDAPSKTLKIGEELELSVHDNRARVIKNSKIVWSSSDEEVLEVDTNGVVKGLKKGKAVIKAVLREDRNVIATIELEVLERQGVEISIRVEGYEDTIVSERDIEVDNFDLTPYLAPASGSSSAPSDGWGPDRIKEATAAHSLIRALESEGIDCKDHEEGLDLQDYGWSLYVAMINGEREFDYQATSGWLYRVDGRNLSYGCQEHKLEDGEEILWYFGVYGSNTWVTEIDVDKTEVGIEEEITLTLKGSNASSKGSKNEDDSIEIKNAVIYVDGESYKPDVEEILTDENGEARIKFKKTGTYEISAERFDNKGIRDIVRPKPIKIKVTDEVIKDYIDVEELWNIIENPNSTEEEICDKICSTIEDLVEYSENIEDEKEAKYIIGDIEKLLNAIAYGKDRLENEEPIKKVAKESLRLIKILSQYSDRYEDLLRKINEEALRAVDVYFSLILKIENSDEADSLLKELIKPLDKITNNCKAVDGKLLESQLIILLEKFIENQCKLVIDSKDVRDIDGRLMVDLDSKDVLLSAEKVIEKGEFIEKQLSSNNIKAMKLLNRELVIEIPDYRNKEVEVSFSRDIIKELSLKDIDRLKIMTSTASLKLFTDIIKEIDDFNNMNINIKTLENDNSYHNADQIELTIRLDDRELVKWNSPVIIEIACEEKVEKARDFTIFKKEAEETMKNFGGIYFEDEDIIRFIANKSGRYVPMLNKKEFKDLEDFMWAKNEIESMASRGIIKGRNEEEFDPSAKISRAEFSALISRMLKLNTYLDEDLSFKDITKDKWYYDAVRSVYKNGYMNGRSNEIFDPDGKITREEIATVAANILKTKLYGEVKEERRLKEFLDDHEVSNWAKSSMEMIIRLGILDRTEDLKLKPKEELNRAQTSDMLYRLYYILMNSY